MMKRWMACLLAAVMMIAACAGAWAQPLSADTLMLSLLEEAARQAANPSFGVIYFDGESQTTLSVAQDEQGLPGLSVNYWADGKELLVNADAAGLRMDDGTTKIAVEPMTLLRALFTDEAGRCFLPDVTQVDIALLEQIAGDVLASASGAVVVERYAAQKDPGGDAVPDAQEEQTTVVIDVNALLAALDAAVPELLTKYAAQIDDFTARNSDLLCELFSVTAFPKAQTLAKLWPAGALAALLPEDIPLTVTLMAGPGEACGAAVLGGEEELLLASYGEGRLVVQIGSGETALLLDSADLTQLLALLQEAAEAVSPGAFAWQYEENERLLRASFHLDADRLAREWMDGLTAAVQRNEQTVAALLLRYAPWLEAFGVQGAGEITWKALTQALLEEKDAIAESLCRSLAELLGMSGYRTYAGQSVFPALDAELLLPKQWTYRSAGSLSVSAGGVQLYAALSNQHLNATLQLGGDMKMRYELSGMLREDGAQLTLGYYDRIKGLQSELLLDVLRQDGGFAACLYDQSRTELAALVLDGDTLRLTSGELTVEAVSLYSGLTVTAAEGEDRFGLQIVESERALSASGYLNGTSAQLQILRDEQGLTVTGDYSPQYTTLSYQLRFKAAQDSLSLDMGAYRMGLLMRGVEADVSRLSDGLHLSGVLAGGGSRLEVACRPGLLEAAFTGGARTWQLRAADLTGHSVQTVTVRVDWNESVKLEEGRQYSERTWLVEAITDPTACTFKITGLKEEPVVATLYTGALPLEDDLTGYTWYNEAETAQMLRELLAPQPDATPEPAAQPAAAQ